ncbi:hypothetical protein ACJMK2_034229 [Sinanodonta woodiana]|uniref:Cadherin domain-containing protein n=1 Tax=Sinanodonta woodiana TaxID=1069815 RepID=A0ABD3WQX6_SINWO
MEVNEFTPVFMSASYNVRVSEDAEVGDVVFEPEGLVQDMDISQSHRKIYRIAPYMITEFDGRDKFLVLNEEIGTIVLKHQINFEDVINRPYFFLNVTVTDEGGLGSYSTLDITIFDVNDLGPEFVIPNCPTPCVGPIYVTYTNESYQGVLDLKPVPILARDMDTLNESVIYMLVADGSEEYFSIDENTGVISKNAYMDNSSFTGSEIFLQVGVISS